MTLLCPACNHNTSLIYSNFRVLHYFCEDCELLHVVHTFPRFHSGKDEMEMISNAAGTSFRLRDKKDMLAGAVPVI